MKLTNIRDYNGKKLDRETLEFIGQHLVANLKDAGYITEYYVINSSRIDLKLRGRSFKIDIEQLGYNAQLNPYMNYKAGYRRTCTPTWAQRVEYNNIINEHLNLRKISCNIKSLHYIIREGTTCFNEFDWENQKKDYEYQNEMRGFRVVPMSEVA